MERQEAMRCIIVEAEDGTISGLLEETCWVSFGSYSCPGLHKEVGNSGILVREAGRYFLLCRRLILVDVLER